MADFYKIVVEMFGNFIRVNKITISVLPSFILVRGRKGERFEGIPATDLINFQSFFGLFLFFLIAA